MPTMTKGGVLPDVMSPAAASAACQDAPADTAQAHAAQQRIHVRQHVQAAEVFASSSKHASTGTPNVPP
jgi:hypothetical protein